ncbi:MAG: GTPase domain-containing protein [Myxococcota bacterium]
MTESRGIQNEINARIVSWGLCGAGITSNLAMIHSKLKENNRGALQKVPTRIDPTVEYEVLPIELGNVGGTKARMHVIGVPGTAAQAPTRKQLLDRIDGIVFVADSRQECLAANVASLAELMEFLADYGHSPTDLPFVIQYNKCDLVDPFIIERLHREIRVHGAAVYEASATRGTGVLKTLTTISKQVIRRLGRHDGLSNESHQAAPAPKPVHEFVATPAPAPAPVVVPPPVVQPQAVTPPIAAAPSSRTPLTTLPSPELDLTSPSYDQTLQASPEAPLLNTDPIDNTQQIQSSSVLSLMEQAILSEEINEEEADAAGAVTQTAQTMLDQPWDAVSHSAKPNHGARLGADLRIISVGEAHRTNDRAISVPLVLGNDDGETITLALSIQLDPLLDGEV